MRYIPVLLKIWTKKQNDKNIVTEYVGQEYIEQLQIIKEAEGITTRLC